jgi:translation elongation factor EF-Ts
VEEATDCVLNYVETDFIAYKNYKLVYRVSSSTARAAQKNPVSKNPKNKTKQKKNYKLVKNAKESSYAYVYACTHIRGIAFWKASFARSLGIVVHS